MKPEREHRIKKSQFPSIEMKTIPLENAKNIRYYREVDSSKTTYILKFRIKKIRYHIDFDTMGTIRNTGFKVKEVDIPTDTYTNIISFLASDFKKHKNQIHSAVLLGHIQQPPKKHFPESDIAHQYLQAAVKR